MTDPAAYLSDNLREQYANYPLEVIIETTGRCNAKCFFCPHEKLARKNDYMSDELFMKIINDLKEIPQEHSFVISPFKVNELLMDPHIFERIAIINRELPNAFIRIFSNFNMATKQDFEKITSIKNLHDINISLNSLDKEEYHAIMGLNLDKTLNNIFAFIEHIKENPFQMITNEIVFSRVTYGSEEQNLAYIDSFNQIFAEYLHVLTPKVLFCAEWIDHMSYSGGAKHQNRQCARWLEMNICCTGLVSFCCMDGEAKYFIGDVTENSVLALYNQPNYKILRTADYLKKEIEPCKFCSLY